eukprot:Unigene12844_Nuclearia_a/m.38986 Unigene12844_Nuclearia_a/g.38986  ORF Unigene12844_Nuclearia_a/g.38986 Unigene12844_Nuclearia_a/m.38986 type:complete len:329 (+) Unigene12844_Nuclearia_a:712-1698(+)
MSRMRSAISFRRALLSSSMSRNMVAPTLNATSFATAATFSRSISAMATSSAPPPVPEPPPPPPPSPDATTTGAFSSSAAARMPSSCSIIHTRLWCSVATSRSRAGSHTSCSRSVVAASPLASSSARVWSSLVMSSRRSSVLWTGTASGRVCDRSGCFCRALRTAGSCVQRRAIVSPVTASNWRSHVLRYSTRRICTSEMYSLQCSGTVVIILHSSRISHSTTTALLSSGRSEAASINSSVLVGAAPEPYLIDALICRRTLSRISGTTSSSTKSSRKACSRPCASPGRAPTSFIIAVVKRSVGRYRSEILSASDGSSSRWPPRPAAMPR